MNTGGNQNGDSQAAQHNSILQALDAVHDPRSPNELRQQASRYLEQVRETDEAPHQGFKLASATDQSPIVRHFGLSLIEYAVRHKWADYTREQNAVLREWVLNLAHHASVQDPNYLTNKNAELWVEIAKRSWGVDWMDMDQLLVRLWDGHMAQRFMVLTILESLSEEIFAAEDHVAALRGNDLNRACIDIFVPTVVLSEQFPAREVSVNVRHGSDGWLSRLSNALDRCTSQDHTIIEQQTFALKILSVLRSVLVWIIPKALVSTNCVHRICACLAVSDMAIQTVVVFTLSATFVSIIDWVQAALDALYALYNRPRFSESDFTDIVSPMFQSDIVALLKELYQWFLVDPHDIDDSKYLMLKRLSEVSTYMPPSGKHFLN